MIGKKAEENISYSWFFIDVGEKAIYSLSLPYQIIVCVCVCVCVVDEV